jgi:tight adherence protein B
MLLGLIFLLIIVGIMLLSVSLFPEMGNKLFIWKEKKEKEVAKELDKIFEYRDPKFIVRLYFILPPLVGFLGWYFSRNMVVALPLAAVGLLIPKLILKSKADRRKSAFNSQLLDAVMVLSSALKAGLSFLQALEVVMDEMPPPISEEFGLVVREGRLGVELEDSLKMLLKRVPSEELELLVNSILVAKETGGDLIKVFSRLMVTIRDSRKLKETVRTLTLQGKLQGLIMSLLPIGFIAWVVSFNPHHFDIMFEVPFGKMLLIVAAILQIIGIILIRKFSIVRI